MIVDSTKDRLTLCYSGKKFAKNKKKIDHMMDAFYRNQLFFDGDEMFIITSCNFDISIPIAKFEFKRLGNEQENN